MVKAFSCLDSLGALVERGEGIEGQMWGEVEGEK
jgi:hypothetical protein